MPTKLFAAVMILAIVAAGALRLSPWFAPSAAVFMTIAYVWQKRGLWRASLSLHGGAKTALGLPVTYLIQLLVTGVFFLIPFGISAAITGEGAADAFGTRELIALGLAGAGCLGAILADRARPPEPEESGYEDLLDRALELGLQPVAMPADIFALARDFADRPDKDLTLAILESTILSDESPFVRRVAQTAIRFMEQPASDSADVHAMVMRGLADDSAWVRYDAVWAGDKLGFADAPFRERLEAIADGLAAPPEDARPEGAEENARFRAARLLAALDARVA
ncbi:hypothetical protein [Aureimonas sp. ME7]|uniref:hypothetical protein n=1 Tax=Aureimonas sp. ME7 TaxID=2744252 RepID=UPI0015F4A45A|nr:hypothetical protein [Aureimonas sp. ME7]